MTELAAADELAWLVTTRNRRAGVADRSYRTLRDATATPPTC
jgi:hypothetical protein